MTAPDQQDIPDFVDHPDADALHEHDHPRKHLYRWKGMLTAKAWAGRELACFFAELEGRGARLVLLFQGGNEFRPRMGGEDMRVAAISSVYELDVFAPERQTPIVDRAERVKAFA